MARPTVEFEFRPEVSPSDAGVAGGGGVDGADPVLEWMDHLGGAHRGWINLQPGIRDEDVPPRPSGLGLLFALPAHVVPVCTWVAGRPNRHGVELDSVGVQHAVGTRVVARLAGLGLPLPEGWRWTQDNPRRGLVVRVPADTPHQAQLGWLLEAGMALCTIDMTGDWRALVYEGR